MGDESWTIERIEDDWADLRQGDYVYCVPLSDLPQGVEQGDRLQARSASGSGSARWVPEDRKAKTA